MLNSLLQGNCLDLLPAVPTGSVDLILCDLPYGTTQNKWDSIIDLDLLWPEYLRVAKEDAAIVLFAQTPFDKVLGASNLSMLKYEWIWEKGNATGHLNAKKMPMKAHENILVFYRKLPTYNPQKTSGHVRKVSTVEQRRGTQMSTNYNSYVPNTYDSTERYPRSVVKFSMDKQKSALHPTQKPVALLEYLIKTYSNPGETVLDNAMGSGSTGVAAQNTGRDFIGMELHEPYFEVAFNRLQENYKVSVLQDLSA